MRVLAIVLAGNETIVACNKIAERQAAALFRGRMYGP